MHQINRQCVTLYLVFKKKTQHILDLYCQYASCDP